MSKSHLTQRLLVTTLAFAAVSSTASAATALSSLSEGDLLITEIMVNPSSTDDARREWFEVYNATSATVDLSGLVLGGLTGESYTVPSTLEVAAGDYALFAVKDNAATNGGLTGIDHVWTRASNRFDNSTDMLSISYGSVTFDSFSWAKTGDFVPTEGYSLQLDPNRLSARIHTTPDYWCEGMTSYGSGGTGTPGAANESCGISELTVSDLVAGDLVITEVMINPSTTDDARREYFEVYNTTDSDINLNGLYLMDEGTDSVQITTDVIAYMNEVILLGPNNKAAVNGGLPSQDHTYVRTTFRFDNTADEIVLSTGTTEIDSVAWTTTIAPAEGYALSLDPDAFDATSNDDAANWCAATSTYGGGDRGTPQDMNNDQCD